MLKPVNLKNKHHLSFLFELLKERYETENVNIAGSSLPSLPTYEEYMTFLSSGRYKHMYIWETEKGPVAFLFLTVENELGTFVLKEYRNKSIAPRAIAAMLKKHPYEKITARINPKNIPPQKVVKALGFEHVFNVWLLDRNKEGTKKK